MVYYVIESQVNGETGTIIPVAYTDKALAEQAYHTALAAAAVSAVPKHGVMLCNEDLFILKQELYTHFPVEPVEAE